MAWIFSQREASWPANPTSKYVPEAAMDKIVKSPLIVTHSFTNLGNNKTKVLNLEQTVNCNAFFTTSYSIHFTICSQAQEKQHKQSSTMLTATEISQAETMWIQTVQISSFQDKLDFLENKRDCCPPVNMAQFGLV